MDWLKQNPFLTALVGAATLIVVIGGHFVSGEAARYDEVKMSFESAVSSLQQLRANKPFPDEAHVAAAKRELDDTCRELDALGKELAVTMPSATPQSFKDELAKAVKDLADKAAAKNVTLSDTFYLGFEKYKSELPSPDVAPALTLQLRSILAVASAIVDSHVQSLDKVSRPPISGEVVQKATAADQEKQQPDKPPLDIEAFDISFVARQTAFRLALNRITELDPPVMIRLVAIDNSAPEGPMQSTAATGAENAPDSPSAGKSAVKPVLGNETLTISLRLASVVSSASKPEQ